LSQGIAAEWIKVVLSQNSQRDSPLVEALVGMASQMMASDYVLQIEAFLGRTPLDGVLPAISVPTLLIASVEDKLAGTEQMRWAHSLIPGGRDVLLLQGGHMLPLEKTDLVVAALGDGLAETVRP
jgi:pimeloyl-ACP methyl ester carboxylesterase